MPQTTGHSSPGNLDPGATPSYADWQIPQTSSSSPAFHVHLATPWYCLILTWSLRFGLAVSSRCIVSELANMCLTGGNCGLNVSSKEEATLGSTILTDCHFDCGEIVSNELSHCSEPSVELVRGVVSPILWGCSQGKGGKTRRTEHYDIIAYC